VLKVIAERLRQGMRTVDFPKGTPWLPPRLRGLPRLAKGLCASGCAACVQACPFGAVRVEDGGPVLDLGKCTFCAECEKACPTGAIAFTNGHALSSRTREGLILHPGEAPRVEALGKEMRRLFGRALKLRQVSAGGCNACEADLNVLTTVVFDLGRFGIEFVASPRHADGIMVTGPVPENMRVGLMKTWQAVPEPKLCIASGSCAIAGGPFAGSPEVLGGVAGLIPVDLFIPGCPPHPITTLDALLHLLGRM